MKTIFVSTVFILTMINCVSAQDIEKQLSRAEEFSLKSGTLIEKEFLEVDKVKSISLHVIRFKNLIENQSVTALRMQAEIVGTGLRTSTKTALLDTDEVDGLIKSLRKINTEILPGKRAIYTEVSFTSRTGFQVGCYYDTKKADWNAFAKLEKYDGDSYVFLSKEELSRLLLAVEKTIPILNKGQQ